MMDTMIAENGVTFKELEKNIFMNICRIGQECTKELLERTDRQIREQRDKKAYRHKGTRRTTVKTVYGEVTYERAVYEHKDEHGLRKFVYLLDEALDMGQVGLVSQNLAEQMVKEATESSYRECARRISEISGQGISASGVWNVIQQLGKKVRREENELVCAHKAGHVNGTKEAPVLFEETDGVYLSLQGKDRRQQRQKKGELKVGLAYAGWKDDGQGRYSLEGKVVTAGFYCSKEFQAVREAQIARQYDMDETQIRLLNADGAGWIRNIRDDETYFQLDPFHKYKAIRGKIACPEAAGAVRDLLDQGKLDEMFRYLELYRDSLSEEKEIDNANALITYFRENESGLIPYEKRGLMLPQNPEGLEYRGMGTMENHIWSVIARRMKHNHSSWSRKGGDNLASILAKKCSGRLDEVSGKAETPIFSTADEEDIMGKVIMSCKVPKTDGKGYAYPAAGHFPALDAAICGERSKLLVMSGF